MGVAEEGDGMDDGHPDPRMRVAGKSLEELDTLWKRGGLEAEESGSGDADHGVLGVGGFREEGGQLGTPGVGDPEGFECGLRECGVSAVEVPDPALEYGHGVP